jgi:ORF6N domain
MFQLTEDEAESLRLQFGTLKRGQHFKHLPQVFTQEGVAMLSSVLRSPRAVQVNRRLEFELRAWFGSGGVKHRKQDGRRVGESTV